jgi:glycosyltransferase involved in cell wall biosynthesis
MSKTNILLVCFEFPPLNTGGSQRPYKFAKQLAKFGYRPIILTTHPAKNQKVDASLQAELEAQDLNIIRTDIHPSTRWSHLSSNYYFNIVDDSASRWRTHLLPAVAAAVKKYQPALLFATMPPFSIGSLAVEIAHTHNLPLVLDWRDAWSQWNVVPYASRLHYALTVHKEGQLLTAATRIISTSAQTQADFWRIHPALDQSKCAVIPNSFEGERSTPQPLVSSYKKRIGYVGSFYYNPYSQWLMDAPWWRKMPHQYLQYTPRKENWLYRTPYFLFQTLQALRQEDQELANKVEVVFAGKKEAWFDDMVRQFDVADMVRHIGWMDHSASLTFQSECDALFLTSSKVVGGLDYSIAGKTFEYFKMGKPILAFVCAGAQRDILAPSGQAILCDPDDLSGSKEALRQFLNADVPMAINEAYVDSFRSEETARQLAGIFDQVIGTKPNRTP